MFYTFFFGYSFFSSFKFKLALKLAHSCITHAYMYTYEFVHIMDEIFH